MVEEAINSVWNFVGAVFMLIFKIKAQAGLYLNEWQLEAAYWSLRNLRREIDAKLRRDKDKKKKKAFYIMVDGKQKKVELNEKEIVDYLLEELAKASSESVISQT